MKYMGSKRSMLTNGLGKVISTTVPKHNRFVDLFTGSGAVAWHVASRYDIEVVASDLQEFCIALSAAVLFRTQPDGIEDIQSWLSDSYKIVRQSPLFGEAAEIQDLLRFEPISKLSARARKFCEAGGGPIFNSYGGYYYSPLQALSLDVLRENLPEKRHKSSLYLAALIWAASRCAASPGHTAQPFKPNETAGKYVVEAWNREIFSATEQAAGTIAPLFAKREGRVFKTDAIDLAASLRDGDVAFLDPPYSGVHYSRFYHVLETLASHCHFEVTGTGRYPPVEHRPQSAYSRQTEATTAFDLLLKTLSLAGSSAIVTFPAGAASNGLSGKVVTEIADQYFHIESSIVTGRFSTLGGNLKNREARQPAEELILSLTPKG